LPLPEIEPRLLGREALSLVAITAEPSRLTEFEVQDRKLGKPGNKLQRLFHEFKARGDDVQMKSCVAFLVNPFLVDLIRDGCTINKILLTETSATELERMEV
jgi:hypothetical protein